MKLEDVKDGMTVVITARGPEHPLHGKRAEVVLVTGPLPAEPPQTLREPSMTGVAHLINSNKDSPADRAARAFRVDSLEQPFAWPCGKVLLSLHGYYRTRGWPRPCVEVSPEHIEPAPG